MQTKTGIPITINRDWLNEWNERISKDGPWDSWDLFKLAYQAERARAIHDFDELQCLRHLPQLKPYSHQIETAKKVLNEMRGRAILADEVGLGKTIEAGLIIKEYLIRGLAKKILILVPASLILQWCRELNSKFGIPAVAQKKEWMWEKCDIVVASTDTAKRDPHRQHILKQDYDMLVIDEAHKLKNKQTKNWQFINEIKKKYCLLLTATPMQNEMKELYNLVTILKPGQLGQYGEFQREYVDGRSAKNADQLQQTIGQVMIRNRRGEDELAFTKRHVKNFLLNLSESEQALYDGVTDYVRKLYHKQLVGVLSTLKMITLQREVCSSRDAVFVTLVNMFKKNPADSLIRKEILELVEIAKQVKRNTKAEKVLELLAEIQDKVIIFTEYRATQEHLYRILQEHGIPAVLYRGGFGRGKKDYMMELFRRKARVMIATEAGGEGINLQFCSHIINFDLPWNPMRVEQRIGRVHRLGQTRDVHIYNLSTQGTIEEHILNLLHHKINLFQNVIGDLDVILEELKLNKNFESKLFKMMMEAESQTEFNSRLEQLGQQIISKQSIIP